MNSNLKYYMENHDLMKSVKPDNMSRSEYESILISLYNKYGDINIDSMRRRLKIRIAILNAIN